MKNMNIEKAFENQLASLKMEGYEFSNPEIENVKKCIRGELSFQQFKNEILKEIKNK
mgnify:FL=1